jgi:protein-L-isoaspartate(D-aspartate) O-methyltransferase
VFPSIDGAPARFLLAPMVLARLIQLAAVDPDDKVLDVGCATGYSTAVLARLGRRVIGLESEPELAATAREALQDLGIANAEIVEGPLDRGHAAASPYDVIFVNGAVRAPPETLFPQLKPVGRLATVLASRANSGTEGKAFLFIKIGKGASGRPRFDAGAKLLPGFVATAGFVLQAVD